MAGKMPKRRPKFPNFIKYANDHTSFQCKTEDALNRAWWLAVHDFAHSEQLTVGIPTWNLQLKSNTTNLLWIIDTDEWSYEFIWEVLSSNQVEFQMLLDAIIHRCVLPIHIELIEKHDNHVRIDTYWLYEPCGLLPDYILGPSLQFYERMRIQDPLDGIYWQLGKFLRLGGELYLRKCPVCERYFIQPTARPQTHCGAACRLKGDPYRREANAEYQKQYREGLGKKRIQKDLKKVKEAKVRLRAGGETDLRLQWVLDEVDISKRWWNSLRRWEEEQYGRPRITDLTRP